MGGTLVSMGLIFIAAMAVAGWLNRKVLLKPIEALVNGTRAVASGDLDTQIRVGGEDELALLARSFNQMTADLRQRRDALREEITERQKAQEELQRSFAAMTDLVLVIDRTGVTSGAGDRRRLADGASRGAGRQEDVRHHAALTRPTPGWRPIHQATRRSAP